MTTNFYVPAENIHGRRVTLPEDEARHAAKVLRLSAGDIIGVVDGRGGWFGVEIDHVDRRSVAGHIIERRSGVGEPPYELVLGFGLVKHRGRFETFLEKAVELGVSVIAPLITERTEKERIREERSEGILISAMKQCGRSRLPDLLEPAGFDEFLAQHSAADARFICHEKSDGDAGIIGALDHVTAIRKIALLVGPEGGFSDDELTRANAAGFKTVSLGPRRLRAETAGIIAAAAVMLAGDRAKAPDVFN